MMTLEEKQRAMRERHGKRRRCGAREKRAARQMMLRRRCFAYLLHCDGHGPALIAARCNTAFGTTWTGDDVQRWIARGCPLVAK